MQPPGEFAMPHYPKPFYRQSRGLWYVQLHGKQVNLGPDREAAFQEYHRLMALPPAVLPVSQKASPYLAELCDEFLDWVSHNRAPATYQWYRERLQQLIRRHPKMTADEIKPYHVEKWAQERPVSVTTRRNLMRSIKRCLTWATRHGYLDKNPIAQLEIPSGQAKQAYVSPEEYAELCRYVTDPTFAHLITTTYQTGCRPQELLRVEARHVDRDHSRWVFSPAESKVKIAPRIIYLSPEVLELTTQLMVAHPTGPLFCNSRGKPWTKDAAGCAFDRLQVRMGSERMKALGEDVTDQEVQQFVPTLRPVRLSGGREVPKTPAELRCEAKKKLRQRKSRNYALRYSLYALRHSWATNALKQGLDSLTVAVLMGHRDPSQLARTYQHLSLHPQHLLSQAQRAIG